MVNVTSFVSIAAFVAVASAPVAVRWVQTTEGNASYQEGRRALDRGEWEAAIRAFERAAEDEALGDAALYWQAYAQQRSGDIDRALELVSELQTRYPESRWLGEARALTAEIRGASTGSTLTSAADEEVKLMALNGLMHMGDDEAIPILEELLNGAQSSKLKERALFVLAQRDSEQAHEILSRTARASADPELQRRAIRYLGIHGSERNLALLAELYRSLDSADARGDVLHAFMVSGEKDRLLELARSEPDAELRGRAIRLLGTMDASAELWELYRNETSEEVKKKILSAFMVSGDTERLLTVARDRSQSEELRGTAVRRLGVAGGGAQLWELYQQETSIEIKKRILHGLFVGGATDRIASVAKNATENVELRKAAIHDLGISGEGTRPALLELYRDESSSELKQGVLHALFLQEAATELVAIAREESDTELKKRAVHWLSLIGSPEAKAFLLELLRQ